MTAGILAGDAGVPAAEARLVAVATGLVFALADFIAEIDQAARESHDLWAAVCPGKHKRQCPKCNPAGNPRPLAVDGHEYRRRLRNRGKRGR